MKAIKVTTAEGKVIIAGHEDANWISAEYRIYPRYNLSQYYVHAVAISSKSKEIYHEWTTTDQMSPSVKIEAIDTESVDPPLRNRPGTHK